MADDDPGGFVGFLIVGVIIILAVAYVSSSYRLATIEFVDTMNNVCHDLGYDNYSEDYYSSPSCFKYANSSYTETRIKQTPNGEWYLDGSNVWHK